MHPPTPSPRSSPPPDAPPRSDRPRNRLADSSSPYLLQHAHNPVPWNPWDDLALAEARRRDVPIFLSVGYSTCYWCHVMERESFEDAAIGELLARDFLPIKLDREEHPEIDEVYMAAIQMLTGRGGWPMSVFLDPHTLRPFWGGTYFPPRPAHGLPSFRQVLEGLARAWRDQRDDLQRQAASIADAVAERLRPAPRAALIGRPQVAMAVQTLLTIFDRTHGGFGGAPKFPQPVYLEFLLDARERVDDPAARDAIDLALRTTLDAMVLGGIHDHVGGGFHRYSVDAAWIVPHFEKMLYDQAQMLAVLARASAIFHDPTWARAARRIVAYLRREMSAPDGAFFSAQDAEVDGREGLNYLWTPDEVRAAVAPSDAALALDLFGLSRGANFRDPHHPTDPPRNVLVLAERPAAAAARLGVSPDDSIRTLDRLSDALMSARARRHAPRLDDKVLASWNGMMIAGLARAGRDLGDPAMVADAARAADAVLGTMLRPDGALLRSRRGGHASIPGVLEDYAWMALGLIHLAAADPRDAPRRLDQAERLVATALTRFSDDHGRLHDAEDSPALFVRPRSTYDGATPCAGSVLLECLTRLGDPRTGSRRAEDWRLAAATALAGVSDAIAESPLAAINSTRSLLALLALDEPAVVEALGAAGAARGWSIPAADSAADLVEVHASADHLAIGPDHPAETRLRLRIAEGHHLAAADPGDSPDANALVPSRVAIVGGTGVSVFAEWPPGTPLDPADPRSPRVYVGEIDFPVALEAAGEWSGRPRLALTYQACNDRACLNPTTVTLDVAIERLPTTLGSSS